jgi:membrane-associated phospholipid phosphatase
MRLLLALVLSLVSAFAPAQQPSEIKSPSGYELMESSKEYIKNLYRCRRSGLGCTTQDKLSLAVIEGKAMSSEDMNKILAQDSKRGNFIPLNLSNERLLVLAAATSLGIVVFMNDQQITDAVTQNRSSVQNTVQDIGNFLGETAVLPIAAGSYFLGLYYQDDKLKQAGLFTVGASIAMGLVTAGVKFATGRKRPNEGDGPYQFWEFGNKSFYSGHTAQAFTIATVFAELYKEEYPVVPYVAYGLATLTAYARVYGEDHWASDVLVGAVAGHLITKWTMNHYKDFMIYPSYNRQRGQYSLVLSYAPQSYQRNEPLACRKIESQMARVSACIDEALNKARGRPVYENDYQYGASYPY